MSVLVWSLIVTPLLVSPPQFTCALAPSLPKSEILSILKDALETSLPQKVLVTGTLCPSQTIVHKAVTAHDTVFYILLYLFAPLSLFQSRVRGCGAGRAPRSTWSTNLPHPTDWKIAHGGW